MSLLPQKDFKGRQCQSLCYHKNIPTSAERDGERFPTALPKITHLLELLKAVQTALPGKPAFLDLIWKTCSKCCWYQRSLRYPSTSHCPRSLLHPCLVHGSLSHPAQCSCPCLHPGITRRKTTELQELHEIKMGSLVPFSL